MEKICVICDKEITADANGWNGGHNAQPVAEGQCCGDCNDRVVTIARLEHIGFSETEAKVLITTLRYHGIANE